MRRRGEKDGKNAENSLKNREILPLFLIHSIIIFVDIL